MKTRLILMLSVVSISMVSSCKKAGCDQPLAFNYDPDGTSAEACVWQPLDVVIDIDTRWGDQSVRTATDDGKLTTDDGRSIQFDHFGVYLTEISFRDGDMQVLLGASEPTCLERTEDAFLLLDSNRTYRGSYLPSAESDLSALIFHIGVDSCRNDSLDPSTQLAGPFSPQVPTMYWSWASGYRFLSVSGTVDASAEADGSEVKKFEYHTGLNQLLRTIELPLSDLKAEGNEVHIKMNFDLQRLLQDVDFTSELVTHTMNNMPLAEKITANATEAFRIDEE